MFEFGEGIAEDEDGNIETTHKYILMPTGKYRLTWDMMLLVILLYIGVMTPYRLGKMRDKA